MKLVHLNKTDATSPGDLTQQITKLESDIKYHPGNEKAHNRLMILYRRQGNYKKELETINRAIKIFE